MAPVVRFAPPVFKERATAVLLVTGHVLVKPGGMEPCAILGSAEMCPVICLNICRSLCPIGSKSITHFALRSLYRLIGAQHEQGKRLAQIYFLLQAIQ